MKVEAWKYDSFYLCEGLLQIEDDKGYNFIDNKGKRLLSKAEEDIQRQYNKFSLINNLMNVK